MASRHWLDPLARRLLIAAGQLLPKQPSAPQPRGDAGSPDAEAVERELLALALTQDPARRLRDPREVALAAELGWQLDVNRATANDWLRLPGCAPDHVDLLLRLQAGGVQLSGLEDLRAVLGVSAELVKTWEPLLRFRWYDGPPDDQGARPVPVNQASPRQLAVLPGLGPDRLARLVRERARQPFRDLADLQLRLRFPPAVVEQWIGRVRFDPGPAGPVLPPAARPPGR